MDRVLPTAQFFALLHGVSAAPSRNLTALRKDFAPPFVPDPDGRGTWSLLYSCLFTLALCVWTAFHPNVKESGASRLRKLRIRLNWIFFTILIPELGVLTAFKQNRKVKNLVTVLSKLRATMGQGNASNEDHAPESDPRIAHESKEDDIERGSRALPPVSKTYGYFVLMGGLIVDVSHLHDRLQTVILTSSGVQRLAETGCFFDVSDQDIQDKSKADFLAKGLVLLQITWTILQCLSRKATGLPLSILEVHILVHAGCALIMYTLWFHKPLDIDEPIKVHIPDETLALMLVQSYGFGMPPYGNLVVPLEFRAARLSGPNCRVWPTRHASESSYLMFNPHSPSSAAGSNGHHIDACVETSTSNLPENSIRSQPTASPVEQTEVQSRVELTIASFDHQAQRMHQTGQPGPLTATKEHDIENHTTVSHDTKLETRKQSGQSPLDSARKDIPKTPDRLRSTTLPVVGAPSLNSNVCYGFSSEPRLGIEVCRQITTGEFLTGGIGPNAYFIGDWTGVWKKQKHDSIWVVQVSDDLRSRLPTTHLNTSTIAHYSPLILSLSHKDFRRWQYAGRALQADLIASVQATTDQNAFLDINSSGSTPEGAYFVTTSKVVDYVTPYADDVADAHLRLPPSMQSRLPPSMQSRVLLMRSLYSRCLEREELKLGSTSGVMMLPGVLYGALHLSLWNNTFPSNVERLLWRISGVVLIAVPLLVAILLALRTLWLKYLVVKVSHAGKFSDPSQTLPIKEAQSSQGQPDTHVQMSGYTSGISGTNTNDVDDFSKTTTTAAFSVKYSILLEVLLISIIITTALYVFSRVFIIVESFISLRHVPVGVYTDVGWTKYIPHL
ncbi:MAG: hypothetical protein Q9202_002345 [Teloschistes flavicans]